MQRIELSTVTNGNVVGVDTKEEEGMLSPLRLIQTTVGCARKQ